MLFDILDDTVVIPSLKGLVLDKPLEQKKRYFSASEVELDTYDNIIVCLSGGKDSIACFLHLIDMGVDLSKVELWHHDIDGNEGSKLMDWLFMRDYVRKFASTFNTPLYFSWLEGGFEGEMLKNNSYSHAHKVETPIGLITLEREHNRSKPGTRRQFPQISPSLQERWCSAALKIDVGRRAVNNQNRFNGKKVLFITGERREESPNRAKYNQLEPHACHRKSRTVDAWRPVLEWSEEQVWEIIARHNVIAPVPYRLGWSRSSCMTCIYNSPRIWSTLNKYFPERTLPIANYESEFGKTISRNKINVLDLGNTVQPFNISDLSALDQSRQENYELPVLLPAGERWVMPAGAFGHEGCGSD